jgi:hypothetical protein
LLEVDKEIEPLFHREFDINPRVTHVGKTTLGASLCNWSPNELAFMSIFAAIKICFLAPLQGKIWFVYNFAEELLKYFTTTATPRFLAPFSGNKCQQLAAI